MVVVGMNALDWTLPSSVGRIRDLMDAHTSGNVVWAAADPFPPNNNKHFNSAWLSPLGRISLVGNRRYRTRHGDS